MTVRQLEHNIYGYTWLTTDTKPTTETHNVVPGSTGLDDEGTFWVTRDGTNWVIKAPIPKEIRVSTVIDAGIGAYAANDVVGNEDCCSTTATFITFSDVAARDGGYFAILGATLFNETENLAIRYDLYLFNAAPTGELRDNWPNTNPIKADISKYLGKISFASTEANGSTVASFTEADPSIVGGIPKLRKCADGSKDIFGVLVTLTAYTQTAGDAIDTTLMVEQY